MADTDITQFGPPRFPTDRLENLPRDFGDAVQRSMGGVQTPADDLAVGSVSSGRGYCREPQYMQQVYCACVNAPAAYPECVFRPCANNVLAYKTSAMQKSVNNAAKSCPRVVNCEQILQMGGRGNVASQITQSQNCGGTVNNIENMLKDHALLVVVFVLVLLLVFVLAAGRRPPAPPAEPWAPADRG